jgi:hypothetical protein
MICTARCTYLSRSDKMEPVALKNDRSYIVHCSLILVVRSRQIGTSTRSRFNPLTHSRPYHSATHQCPSHQRDEIAVEPFDQSTEFEGITDDWQVPELGYELGVVDDLEDWGGVVKSESIETLEEAAVDMGR